MSVGGPGAGGWGGSGTKLVWSVAALVLLAVAFASGAAAQREALAYRLPAHSFDGPPVRSDTVDVHAPPDEWLGRDKVLHAGGSFLLTLSSQYVLVDKGDLSNGRALPLAAGAALSLGVLKEVLDSRRARHPLFSWRDLVADALGVAAAAAVVGL